MCVIAIVGVAPCQCFSLGPNQTTSPGRISSIGPPSRWAKPTPAVTINVWPNGCVCQAVRALASKVTLAQRTRAGSGASNNGSILTFPVNQSFGPFAEGWVPDLLISTGKTRLNNSTTQQLNVSTCRMLDMTLFHSAFSATFPV